MATTRQTAGRRGAARSAAKADAPALGATLTEMQRAGFGQLAWLSAAMAETVAVLGAEVVQFTAARLSEDVRLQHALLACRGDLAEMQRLQAEFLREALEQYRAETGRLVELGSGIMAARRGGEH